MIEIFYQLCVPLTVLQVRLVRCLEPMWYRYILSELALWRGDLQAGAAYACNNWPCTSTSLNSTV